jgi:hypothetical protein
MLVLKSKMTCFKLGILGCDTISWNINAFWEQVDGLSLVHQ